jgi:hypothetical protein
MQVCIIRLWKGYTELLCVVLHLVICQKLVFKTFLKAVPCSFIPATHFWGVEFPATLTFAPSTRVLGVILCPPVLTSCCSFFPGRLTFAPSTHFLAKFSAGTTPSTHLLGVSLLLEGQLIPFPELFHVKSLF